MFGQKSKETNAQRAKVISLLNQKGGVGKTTLAFHLAHALGARGHRVLAIDMDPQANLSVLMGAGEQEQKKGVFPLLLNSIKELKALHTPIMFHQAVQEKAGVDLLASQQDLSGFELTVAGISAPRQLIFKNFLERFGPRDGYDYIIVDGPPTLGLLMVNILCASDGVLVPFQPDRFSREGLKNFTQVLENVEDMGVGANPKVLGLVPNLVDGRRKQTQKETESLQAQKEQLPLGVPIFPAIANRVQFVHAQAQGRPLSAFKSKEYALLNETFEQIAKQVEKELPL